MCTVTFIPVRENIYLTSNRDEHFMRSPASFPEKYAGNTSEIIYPKDKDAGGSWIAMKTSGDAAVLLNGAFTKHSQTISSRKSRGLIFIEIIKSSHPDIYFDQMELEGIEPFTMIIFLNGRLCEFRWNVIEKFTLHLDPSISHIWSSVTLYNETARSKRRNWFNDWKRSTKNINSESILNFHRSAEEPMILKTG
ncbi:MAG TPA: NRDE family protein [Puia sp.]|nr:NRDE family protein [Puia sp.]